MGRNKYKRYWYPGVMDAIRNYDKPSCSRRETEIKEAIEDAIAETVAEEDGEATIQIVTLSLIRHTHTLEGAAITVPGLSPRKARRLRTKFIYRVAEKIGY